MEVIIKPDPAAASQEAARIFQRQLAGKPTSVLGLATGSTPLGLYRELVERHRTGAIDFSHATTFNLDEYVGLSGTHPQSYRAFMEQNLFSHINLHSNRAFVPNGMAQDIPTHCAEYEDAIRRAGGIDLQLLGLGSDGHIGFNEPSSSLSSRTRLKTLTPQTIADNARFFGSPADVPRHVITMGVGAIMEAAHIVVLAIGRGKAHAVAAMVEGPIMADVPASILQMHRKCTLILDEAAAESLKRQDYYRWVYDHKPDWQRL
jgi:glucosamine-6-phosphate deaminase